MNRLLVVCVLVVLAIHAQSADIKAIFDSLNYEDKCGQMTQVTFQVLINFPKFPSQQKIHNIITFR